MTFKQQCFLKIYELTEKGREGGRGEGRLVNFKNFLMALKYCFFLLPIPFNCSHVTLTEAAPNINLTTRIRTLAFTGRWRGFGSPQGNFQTSLSSQ